MAAVPVGTSPIGPLACILWHVVQATWFFAWLLCNLPTCVGVLRWQPMQILSAAAAVSLAWLPDIRRRRRIRMLLPRPVAGFAGAADEAAGGLSVSTSA